LEVANIHLETAGGSHLDGEEVMVVLLDLLVRGVLREEQHDEILEFMDRSWRRRVEPIRGYSLQAGREDPTQDGSLRA